MAGADSGVDVGSDGVLFYSVFARVPVAACGVAVESCGDVSIGPKIEGRTWQKLAVHGESTSVRPG